MFKTDLVRSLLEYWNLKAHQEEELIRSQEEYLSCPQFVDFFKSAERLMIAGDYDADGVMSTALAVLMAKKMGIKFGYYIPNRLKEGYGLKKKTIQMAYDKGYTDLLLVDNGVSLYQELEFALSLGMRVAVVDHHLVEFPLNKDVVWVHPDLIDNSYFSNMSAGGLMISLAESMALADPYMYSLAALSTIADVMPLWGKNREITKKGLAALNEYDFPQFSSLVNRKYLNFYTAEVLAFQVSPKINSLGRLSDVANINTAVEYFTSEDIVLIQSFAKQVIALNDLRKRKGAVIEKDALKKISFKDSVQVISDENYHEGLLGIVANKVAQVSQSPAILLQEQEDVYKGSGRSHNKSLSEIISILPSKFFVSKGGHDFAFGLSIKKEYYHEFRQEIQRAGNQVDFLERKEDVIRLPLDFFDYEALSELHLLEPLGEGLKLPNFSFEIPKNKKIIKMGSFGYKFVFNNSLISEAVYFNKDVSYQECLTAKKMICRIDMQSLDKLSLFIEKLI